MAEQRSIALRQQLLGTVSGEAPVPKTALEAFNRFQNEERTIDYVTLGPAQAGDIAEPDARGARQVFRGAQGRVPRAGVPQDHDRGAHARRISPSRIEVSDADLKKAYTDRRARYETPERRHLKQIVFPNMEEAKAAADKLAQGTTFEALAAERGLKDSDIDLGTVAKSAMVDRDVADAAFALKSGEVSAPVQGRFGIAIVKVDAIEAGKTRPFEEVAAELKRDIAERARQERNHQRAGKGRGRAARRRDAGRRGAQVQSQAARRSRRSTATARMRKGNAVPDLPQNVDVLSAAFGADVHGENEPLRVPNNGGYVWFDVDAITPARDRPLDEVKDQVVARWRDDEMTTRLRTKATEMLDKIKAGTSFADVAAADKLKVEWRPGIKRSGPPTGLSAAAVAEIFKTPQDAAGSVEGASPTERIVFRVTEIKVPPLDPEAADAKRIDEALKARTTEDLIAQYLARLQSEIGVSINQSALNQVTGGGTQN